MRALALVLAASALLAASLACTRADVLVPTPVPESAEPTALPTESVVPTEEPTALPTLVPTSVPILEPTPAPAPVFFLREEVMSGRIVLEIPKIKVESGLRMGEEAMGPNGPYLTKGGVHPLWIPNWGSEIGNVGVALIYGERQWGPLKLVFTDLDKLESGDLILFRYRDEVLEFAVSETVVVEPADFWLTFFRYDDAALQEGRIRIALVTCTPWGTAQQRLIVFAELVPQQEVPSN